MRYAGGAGDRGRKRLRLLLGGSGDLGEQPATTVRELGPALHHACDPLVEALAGDERVLQQCGYGVRRVGHRRVAEHRQRAEGRVLDEAHGRVEHDAQGALGADQEPVEPAAVLGEQVLEGVAGDLAPEATELGADELEVVVDEGVESVDAPGG